MDGALSCTPTAGPCGGQRPCTSALLDWPCALLILAGEPDRLCVATDSSEPFVITKNEPPSASWWSHVLQTE